MKKIGAAYVRVSTDDQTEYSPDSQLKLIRDFANRVDYIIPPEFVFQDDGISGKSADKRPAFRLMVSQARQTPPPFQAVFVWKYSRFARNQEEAIVYKNLLKKQGIDVVSISEPSSDNPFSSLIERIIEWMDEYYIVNLGEEVRRGMTEKARRGECMGTAPFGYRVENKILVPVPSEAETVKYIFERFAAGTGVWALAIELNTAGIMTRRGNPVDNRWVHYILTNPAYIGKTRWSTEGHANYDRENYSGKNVLIVDGRHEPIINTELWNAVQTRIKESRRELKNMRQGAKMYMLRGLVRCGACGATLSYTSAKDPALQCSRYCHGQCVVSHYIALRKLNEMVIRGLEQAIDKNTFVFAPAAAQKARVARDWDKLIAQEQARLKRAKSALLDGAFTSAEYKEMKAEIESKILALTMRQDVEASNRMPAAQYRERVIDVLDTIISPDESEQAKNEALRQIIDRIVFKRPENTIDIFFT